MVVTRRRLLLALTALLVAAIAWTLWSAIRTAGDLRQAQSSVDDLTAAIKSGDDVARDRAVADLESAAGSAHDRTDGLWWSALTKLPVVGDDAGGVRALSASIDTLATDAISPLIDTVDALNTVVSDGRVDVQALASLQAPVAQAHEALLTASDLVSSRDSSGYASALKTRYLDYAKKIGDLEGDLGSADTAIQVLPGMLGADGPRDYLFIFQNNAEIRATGGLPGSWAHITADDGAVSLDEQGSAADFPFTQKPYVPLTKEEVAVYGSVMGQYFQDPNFTPDFPRAAELFNGFWASKYPETELDGVLALDPVAMSYLLAGTGPIQVGDVTLTSSNIVDTLLRDTYQLPDPQAQDAFFQEVARAIFTASTTQLVSPIDFVQGLARAGREGRFLVAPFDDPEAQALDGATVLGQLSGDDGSTPHVDIGINDATASKMSYYLRYYADVRAHSCTNGVQHLLGEMRLGQTITQSEAADLPDYVVGDYAAFGLDRGSQVAAVRIYGPHGGTIDKVRLDGKAVLYDATSLNGRPVVTLFPYVESADDALITWEMDSGPDQSGDVSLDLTPSVVAGAVGRSVPTAC